MIHSAFEIRRWALWGGLMASVALGNDGPQEKRLVLQDLDGVRHQVGNPNAKATVLVFINTDCPLANAYHPTLRQLQATYRSKGIRVLLVHSDPDVTNEAAKEHAKQYSIASPVVLDATQRLAKSLGVRVTPEAAVVDAKGKLVYRGRIDDLFADYGKKRVRATQHDLRDAIQAIVEDRPVKVARTKAIGCHIYFESDKAGNDESGSLLPDTRGTRWPSGHTTP